MNVFIMTKSMGGDDGLAANAILAQYRVPLLL